MGIKKKNVVNLIKYYFEKNDLGFKGEAEEIIKSFKESGDLELADYIAILMSERDFFTPQSISRELEYLAKVKTENQELVFPTSVEEDLAGVANAILRSMGLNKILFEGKPGTGKTEAVKKIAKMTKRELFSVDFNVVIDSRLGETSKNIARLFQEIKDVAPPTRIIILFDEIDIIALDRINSRDMREMGRATSFFLKELDKLSEDTIIIATTNLFGKFDDALARRFDIVINFDRYTNDDLIKTAEAILNNTLRKFGLIKKNKRLFEKILTSSGELPRPGELKNIIKRSVVFSSANDDLDYLAKMYSILNKNKKPIPKELIENGFTVREAEILTGISKSKISREYGK